MHPDEFTALFNTILINVTGFFRDAEAWEYLRRRRPARAARGEAAERSRCGSGARAARPARRPTPSPWCWPSCWAPTQFRERVKIYATDVDEEALAEARQAVYTEREVRGIPPELLERYFELVGRPLRLPQGPAPVGDLRAQRPRAGRPDLPHRPAGLPQHPDVLQRRDPGAHPHPLPLRAGRLGVLFLGKAEMLLSHGALFTPVDLKQRIFRKAARDLPRNGMMLGELPPRCAGPNPPGWTCCARRRCSPPRWPQVVVTADGVVAAGQPAGRAAVRDLPADVGRPFRDLELSYRPVELRRHIEQAQTDRRTVRVTDVTLSRGGKVTDLEIQVSPLVDGRNRGHRRPPSSFHDVTATAGCRTSSSRPTTSWRRRTRSSSRPTRSWRPPTRSSSPPSRSWRPPTRSSSPPTRSWRP